LQATRTSIEGAAGIRCQGFELLPLTFTADSIAVGVRQERRLRDSGLHKVPRRKTRRPSEAQH
jgi:hypothetical protein